MMPEFLVERAQEFLSMTIAFTLLGAAALGLCRLLRLKPVRPKIENPRRSSVCALIAVSTSMFIGTLLLLYRASHEPADTTGMDPQLRLLLYLAPQLISIPVYCVPMALMLRLNRETFQSAGLNASNLWKVTIVGLLLATFTLINLGGAKHNYAHFHPVAALVYFSLVGFGEEFLFRGYLQTRLVAWLGSTKGWMLASVITVLMHVPNRMAFRGMGFTEALVDTLMLIPVSLFSGFVVLRTGNIIATTIFHTFADWVNTR